MIALPGLPRSIYREIFHPLEADHVFKYLHQPLFYIGKLFIPRCNIYSNVAPVEIRNRKSRRLFAPRFWPECHIEG
jgi:hypothetical protein